MAELICSIKDYHKFIGPRVRNFIQSMTKKRKKELDSICQMCNKKKELEAAHIHGNGRKDIIDKLLEKYFIDKDKQLIKINLSDFENELKEAHKPIDKYFKFLCSSCHKKYDSK